MTDFAGDWQTTFGPMTLQQEGKRVHGVYHYMNTECTIEGDVDQGRLVFRYHEPTVEGQAWFELTRRGKALSGQFRPHGAAGWEPWDGERVGFDGLWNTSFGLMRLIEDDGNQAHGFYDFAGSATIQGERTGNRLVFSYKEPKARGRGRFELAADGLSFTGEWKGQGEQNWRPWTGIRVRPQPNLTWLVVIEAPWQRFLSEREYAFGHMLREFFARVNHVQVRHRFFNNEAGLRKCCRDLLYIAEPVVLLVATHGQPDGISVDGQTIGVRTLIDELRHAGNLRLLHFSACLVLQGPEGVQLLQAFADEMRLPISGYRTSVDWAASAILEFTYLDLVLSRGLTPPDAAGQLVRLLPFAGDEELKDTAYRPAGFTLVRPRPPAGHRAPAGKRRSRVQS